MTSFIFLIAAFLACCSWLVWLLWRVLKLAFMSFRRAARIFTLGICAIAACTPGQVHAGWLWGPDPKVEAANQALQNAAEIATQAAQTQSAQQAQLLHAIEQLSSERTHLANHLRSLGEVSQRESVWAAALNGFAPVLVAVSVLLVAVMALYVQAKASPGDSQAAAALVEEIMSPNSVLAIGYQEQPPTQRQQEKIPGVNHSGLEQAYPDSSPHTQEMPF
jgi:hypothetical protein